MKVHYYTQDKALLAYIDLLGTKTLYIKNTEPLEDMARRLFEPLLAVFNVEFQNRFSEQEIRDNFCVSIYSDSIMICSKVDTADIIEKLISFLLKFQHESIFGISDRYRVPFRALIDREPYFFIRFEQPEEGSILQSKYTTSSLLGGRGMVVMDTKLKKLPVGVYVSEKIKNQLIAETQKRAVSVKEENFYFIKQDKRAIDFLFLFPVQSGICSNRRGKTLEEIFKNVFVDNMIPYDETKWRQWIDVHEDKIFEISRIKGDAEDLG